MSIELNKPEGGGNSTTPSNESLQSLGVLFILAGVVLDFLNLLFRAWYNPVFVLFILIGWCMMASSSKLMFRIGASVLLCLVFLAGGFLGRPLYHVIGIIIGISVLMRSEELAMLMKRKPDGSTLLMLVQKMRSILKTLVIAATGSLVLAVVIFFASREFMYQSETAREVASIKASAEKYKSDTGAYPESLAKLIGNDPLKREWLTDGWKNAYRYELKEGKPSIASAGSDGSFGNGDDLK